MNTYWLIAGILMVIGGLMHTITGEKKVIRKLIAEKEKGNFPDNESFNLIRWFWYMELSN